MIKTLFLAFLLSLCAARARALELALEENRAQRGNIGYVDLQRVFKLFPETIRAKENFDEVVRQASEQVNMRKVEIIRLRADIAQLKLDRETAARTAAAAAPPPPAPPPEPAKAPVLTPLAITGTPGTVGLDVLPSPRPTPPAVAASSPSVSASTQAAIILPGMTASTITVSIAASTPPATAETAAVAAPPVPAVLTPRVPANPLLAELDERIAHKTKWLGQKEEELKQHQADAEKNLLDLEGRKTEILLGKIHKVVKEVARQEGVSVVVDKGSILFGHDAVDLTERVLKALKGS